VGRTFVAGFESIYHPGARIDAIETTAHSALWEQDLASLTRAGIRHVRYPLRWHRIEAEPGRFDWAEPDRVLERMRELGLVPIVDLVHHTTYPDWLSDGFRGADFGPTFERYAAAVAERYPWLGAYTLFNEPFATLFLAGHESLWPPYDRDMVGFRRLLLSVLPAVCRAGATWRELLPAARHLWIDTAEHHTGVGSGAAHAEMANDRRHVVLDLVLGHSLDDSSRPFLSALLRDGGEHLLELPRLDVDMLGLDYYRHSEWFYDDQRGHTPSPQPIGLAGIIQQYAQRYDLPLMLTETNIRGLPSDRATWLRYTLEQYELALARGFPLHGYGWFPHVDSADWDSLLARCAGRVDPVGVYSRRPDGTRIRTLFTEAWEAAAAGLPVAELPALRPQPPCDEQLTGIVASLGHWPWRDPSPDETVPAQRVDVAAEQPVEQSRRSAMTASIAAPTPPDLVVLSHLRWPWVWQRPQHIVSRLAAQRAERGARTWFVEEPIAGDVPSPVLATEETDGVLRTWLVLPPSPGDGATSQHIGFEGADAGQYAKLLASLLHEAGRPPNPDVWLYTPMALDIAQQLDARRLVYDVMDDLASFKGAPEGLVLRQRRLLADADIVFTGGVSLHRGVRRHRTDGVHLFRSGVEGKHYSGSRRLRKPRDRKVAGYVGVIDERLDLGLVRGLADALPDWTIRLVGPVAKIDAGDLPQAPNLEYPGMASYAELPEVMAGFDVALMPFALNEATRSISPTKTLEYLAAGLPVVSTRVPDVVSDYSEVVHLADDGAAFAAACRKVVADDFSARDRLARPLLARQEWDSIAASMAALVEAAGSGAVMKELA
jgi:beta-glucosidase/6-phospho-beta-glucosidase/beta-galactosidase/glycosyltransferase involved in cell wall biosynthesis